MSTIWMYIWVLYIFRGVFSDSSCWLIEKNWSKKKSKLTTIDKTFVSLPPSKPLSLTIKTEQLVLTDGHHTIWQCQYLRETSPKTLTCRSTPPAIRVTSVTMIVFNCALIRPPLSLPSPRSSSDSPPPRRPSLRARASYKRLQPVISLWNVIFKGELNTKVLEEIVFIRNNYVAYCVFSVIQKTTSGALGACCLIAVALGPPVSEREIWRRLAFWNTLTHLCLSECFN